MSVVAKKENCLIYRGSNGFRMRLILSVLSGRPVKINDIRCMDDFPGLRGKFFYFFLSFKPSECNKS